MRSHAEPASEATGLFLRLTPGRFDDRDMGDTLSVTSKYGQTPQSPIEFCPQLFG